MAGFPSMDQYNDAVQNPTLAFSDTALKNGKVVSNGLGIPLALGGGFALTYTVLGSGKKFAVRCFHKRADGLEQRYPKISQVLSSTGGGYFVGFEYQPQGILVNGARYPIVKMDWAEGETLGSYIERHYADKAALQKIREGFLALDKFLASRSLAHGDLQNGNVVVNGGIKLIDYDGMYVPGLPVGQGTEIGQRHFQHPKRSASDFGPKMDRFAFIAIDLSLRALIERPKLFKRFSNGDNILFTANDYTDPDPSALFAELRSISQLTRDVDNFAQICAAPISSVPTLQDFLAGKNIPARIISVAPAGTRATKAPPAYIGAYDVLDATDYDAVARYIGDRIEIIGCIADVKLGETRRGGRPYVFINFGPWRGRITKVNIWSEGLTKLSSMPSGTWVGKWISVTGLVDPPYSSRRYGYTHLSITITEANQLRVIDEAEAKRRLGSKTGKPNGSATAGNRAILEGITGVRDIRPKGVTATSPPATTPQQRNKAILAGLHARGTASPSSTAGLTKRVSARPTSVRPNLPSGAQRKSGIPAWVWWIAGIIGLILLSSLGGRR